MFAPTAASRCLTVGTPEVNRVGLAPIDRFMGAKLSPGSNYPNVHFTLPLSESRLSGTSDGSVIQVGSSLTAQKLVQTGAKWRRRWAGSIPISRTLSALPGPRPVSMIRATTGTSRS